MELVARHHGEVQIFRTPLCILQQCHFIVCENLLFDFPFFTAFAGV